MKSKITLVSTTFLVGLLLLVPSGCISDFEANLPETDDNILIVTGDIVENTEVEFILSKGFSLDRPFPPSESQNVDAVVTVFGSDGYQSPPATPKGKGVYRLAIGELKDDVSYGVRITYFGDVYTSEPSRPFSTPEIDSLTWVQSEKFGDVEFRISTHGDAQYYRWTYEEDWEYPARLLTEIYFDYDRLYAVAPMKDHFNPKYNCWKKNIGNKLLVGTTEALIVNKVVDKPIFQYPSYDGRFRSLYCVKVVQKAISKEAYEYYLNKKVENEEMGGLFTPQPSEVQGNITCQTDPSKKAVGYISALKNVTWKRIFIDSHEISRIDKFSCSSYSPAEIEELRAKENLSVGGYLKRYSLHPVGTWREDGGKIICDVTSYAPEICVDCVMDGGTKNKPDFWPRDIE